MNRKVLLVDRSDASREAMEKTLQDGYEVHTATDARRALEACELHGPFAVVLTHDQPSEDGAHCWRALLGRFRRGWPDTSRVLVTRRGDVEAAIEALQEGSIFRLLREDAPAEAVVEAVESSVQRYRQAEEERLVTEQLLFCRESLLELTETLEDRLTEQLARTHRLQRFIVASNEVPSIEALADLVVEVCARLFGERAVYVLLEDVALKRQVERTLNGPLGYRVHTEPVRTRGDEIGLIQIDEESEGGERLGGTELQLLRALATSSAQAARNLVNRHVEQAARQATIHALSRLAESRDDETAKHLDRVSLYCRLVAEGLREDGHFVEVLTDGFIDDLALSAPLHDIGKVGIPDSILLKPGPLNEREWEVMKKHPTIGAETIHHVIENAGEETFLRMGLEIAWCHHERWDGAGYPRGLKAGEIPLAARIMALADVYDALTTWRPYKQPWTHGEALAYLMEERGSHFDPLIIDAFVKRAEEADAIRVELADEPNDVKAPAPA